MHVLSAFCSAVRACVSRSREPKRSSPHCCRPASRGRARISLAQCPSLRSSERGGSPIAMTNRERRWVSALVIEMARDDPEFVLEVIRKLKRSGEIEADDLVHVKRIARRWVKIAQGNLTKARR